MGQERYRAGVCDSDDWAWCILEQLLGWMGASSLMIYIGGQLESLRDIPFVEFGREGGMQILSMDLGCLLQWGVSHQEILCRVSVARIEALGGHLSVGKTALNLNLLDTEYKVIEGVPMLMNSLHRAYTDSHGVTSQSPENFHTT